MRLKGKVLDADGYPIPQIVEVKEIVTAGVPGSSIGSAWVDQETGEFELITLSENSLVQVSSHFYKPQTFIAKDFKGEIRLQEDGIIIEGKPKKDNTIAAIAIALLVGVGIYAATRKPTKEKKEALNGAIKVIV